MEQGSQLDTICEERFEHPAMVGFYPPLPNTVKSLLYFADYSQEEYEPVLDENMLVYSYGELNAGTVPAGDPVAVEATVEDFLYLDHKHADATRQSSADATVLICFTGHSCSILRFGPAAMEKDEARDHLSGPSVMQSRDDLEVVRAFHTRYYLMTVVALSYRPVLLDFNERSALVSKRLLQDQESGRLTLPSIAKVNELRTEFLHFTTYWHFDDISCKQTDNDLFRRLCVE